MSRIAVFGATSAIAQHAIRLWAGRGDALHLVARNADHLAAVADDARVRGAQAVTSAVADLDRLDLHPALVDAAAGSLGGLDVVLVAHGVLGEPARYEVDPAAAVAVLHTNLVSPASLLTLAAGRVARPGGVLAALGSVAGDRGRGSNSIYGASKAGLDALLSGLRNRMFRLGVQVVTIKPGFVDTPMTALVAKNPLFAAPAQVGAGLVAAIDRRRDVVYLPGFWRPLLWLVRALPEPLFKRLRL